jgi:hypothetical protein
MRFSILFIALVLAGWTTGASAAGVPCRDVPGAEALWSNPDRRFVVFGEGHGTNEIPELFGEVVCQASASRTVVVALEWPQQMIQASLDAYMASDGSEAAKKRFLLAELWNSPVSDGRMSQAMFHLIERLRLLKAGGRSISIQGFMPQQDQRLRQDYYELEMARNLANIAIGNPSRPLVLVLTGNVHAAKLRTDASRGELLGAVGHLPPAEVVSLNVARNGGAQWACNVDKPLQPGVQLTFKDITCKSWPWPPSPDGVIPRGITITPIQGGRYDGLFSTGAPMTASPPAKASGPPAG